MVRADLSGMRSARIKVLMAVVLIAFLAITVQLYTLQVLRHDTLRRRSEQNAMRTVPVEAIRGRITDRNGVVLVGSRPAYTVGVIPAEVKDAAHLDSMVCPILQIPPGTVSGKVSQQRQSLHRPIELRRDAPFQIIAYLEEHRHELPGIVYFVESRRRYPFGILAAHLLGYVREVRESQLKQLKDEGYALGDLMGQAGVEATYERELRGEKGEEYQEVTATGRVVDSHRREPVRGMDARLSIDLALQQVAESAMDSIRRGALVALDPRTGEILALVSRPAFNPDIFSTVVPPEIWRELNDDVERPLFNRATMGTYPPGSTAKMVSAAAGLETGVLDSSTRLRPCTGGLAFGNRVYACWNKRGHGSLNVVHAIEASCNVFFYQVGERVGVDKWGTYARLLGLGQKTGIDLPGEDEGVVPSTQVYDRRFGKGKWGRGEALNVGIGQGIVLVTPVQMARYAAALATGYLVTPHLAIGFTDTNGVEHAPALRPPKPVSIQPDVLRLIRSAMVLVTEGGSGTAHRAAVPGFHVAGKTGTAQNPHGDDHSWFVGFAPVPNPTIAIAVICENAGHGSTRAAPVAGAVLRRHLLGPEQPRPKKDEEMTAGHPIAQLRN